MNCLITAFTHLKTAIVCDWMLYFYLDEAVKNLKHKRLCLKLTFYFVYWRKGSFEDLNGNFYACIHLMNSLSYSFIFLSSFSTIILVDNNKIRGGHSRFLITFLFRLRPTKIKKIKSRKTIKLQNYSNVSGTEFSVIQFRRAINDD